MNRLLTLLFLAFGICFLNAQNIKLLNNSNADVSNSIVTINIQANSQYQDKFKIQNTTSSDILYRVERILLTAPICSGSDIFYCATGQCYPPDTATFHTSSNDTLKANQTVPGPTGLYGIDADYWVGATCCDEDVMYKVVNVNNSNDFVTITLRYVCAVGINEGEGANVSVKAFPNPSNSILNVQYEMNEFIKNTSIEFYDVIGKKVQEIVIENKEGLLKVDVSQFSSGVYFYTLYQNNEAIITRKIIINSSAR